MPWNLIAFIPAMQQGDVVPDLDWIVQTALPGDGGTVAWGTKACFFPASGDNLGKSSMTSLWIVEMIDGLWVQQQQICALIDDAITAAGGPDAFIKTVVQPAVNAWAANRFSAAGEVQQPSVAVSLKLKAGLVNPTA